MEPKCNVNITGNSSFYSNHGWGAKLSGPDVNGDGMPDELIPTQIDIQYEGDQEYCKKTLETWFPPQMLSKVIWSSSGKFTLDAFNLMAISAAGMEKVSGNSWRRFVDLNFFDGHPPYGADNIWVSGFGLLHLSSLAYPTGEYEGTPEINEHNYNYSKDDSKVIDNPDGSITVRGGRTTSSSYTKTVKGTLKRSGITVKDIVDSPFKHALEVPYPSGNIRIGTKIRVVYKNEVPKDIRDKYPSAVSGNVLSATVINIENIYFQKTTEGKYEMMTGFVGLEAAPLGEKDILNSLPFYLRDTHYTIAAPTTMYQY